MMELHMRVITNYECRFYIFQITEGVKCLQKGHSFEVDIWSIIQYTHNATHAAGQCATV